MKTAEQKVEEFALWRARNEDRVDAPQPWPSPREEEQDDLLQQRHESLKRQQHQWLLQRRGWLNRRQEWLNQQLREAESEDTREG